MKKLYTHKAMRRRKKIQARKAIFEGPVIPGVSKYGVDLESVSLSEHELLLLELLEDLLSFSASHPGDDMALLQQQGDYRFSQEIIVELKKKDELQSKLERVVQFADDLNKRKQHEMLSDLLNDFIDYIVNHFNESTDQSTNNALEKHVIATAINDYSLLKEIISEVMQERPGFVRRYLEWLSTTLMAADKKSQATRGVKGCSIRLFKQHKQAVRQASAAMSVGKAKVGERVSLNDDESS